MHIFQKKGDKKTMSELKHKRFFSLDDQNIRVPAQRTPEWFDMRRGKLSGSKLSNFLFINSQEEAVTMYKEVFEGQKKPEFTAEQKSWCAWGSQHEDEAMFNLLENIKDIYVFEAPMVQHTENIFLASSPDGFYDKFNKQGDCIESGVVEIKCPAKAKKASKKVTYYYVPQMYLEMACSGRRFAIFCSWGPKKTRAWKIRWNDDVWRCLCETIDVFRNIKQYETYDKFGLAQFHLKRACHQAVEDAELLGEWDSAKIFSPISNGKQGSV